MELGDQMLQVVPIERNTVLQLQSVRLSIHHLIKDVLDVFPGSVSRGATA